MTSLRNTHLTLLVAVTLLSHAGLCADAPEHGERWDRNVDRAALAAQHQAIAKYNALVKKYAGAENERTLRIRLLEAMEGAANLEFRIAHGEAHLKKRPVDLTKYHASLKSVVNTASFLIRATPLADDIHRIYFVRGQAYGELNQISNAKKDYEFITIHFPKTTWAVRGNLALAGYATEAKNHKLAVEYLKRVEEFPDDPHYPFALYQLAWSYYNLNDIPTAVSYLRQHIVYYKTKRDSSPDKALLESEKAYLEHSLKDVVTFFFDGYQRKLAGYSLSDALPTFRKIESGPPLGKMLVLFAKSLRTRDLVDALAEWQSQIIAEESERPEAIEVVMVNVDALFLRKSLDRVVAAASGFKELDKKTKHAMRKSESYEAAQNLILQVAASIQKTISATKNQDQLLKLSRILAGVYESFTAIVEESDPRLSQIHYNLAETLFNIKEFDAATVEYQWVLSHWQKKAALKREDVSLKAIASRYQSLVQRNQLPKDLKPAKLSEDEKPKLKELEPFVSEWIGWVDDYLDDFGRTPKSFEEFELEASRILYSKGQTRAALARLMKLVKARPESSVATAAASLTLDTYVFDKQWELLLEASERFLEMPKLGDAAFRKRVEGLPADASFKLLEASYEAKDYQKALAQIERFTKKYPQSPRLPDCLFLASRAADKLGEKDKSLFYLSELLTKFPKTDKRSVALLARAALEDSALDFDAAARDYAEYLAATAKEGGDRSGTVKRLMFVSWLSKKPKAPDCKALDGDDDFSVECDRYHALVALATGSTEYDPSELIKKSLYSKKDNRALWSAVALVMGGRTIGYKDRLSIAQSLAERSKDLDPLIQFVLTPVMNRAIPEAFSTCRRSLPGVASLKSSTSALARRIELIKHLETAAAKAVALPWARVKIAVLSEVAQVYDDFCAELARLPAPDGLSAEELAAYKKSVHEILDPFREKGKGIRAQAMELAAEFAVSPDDVTGMPRPERQIASRPEPIDFSLFAKTGEAPPDRDLYPKWEEALKSHAWARVGFIFQQLKEKTKPKESSLALMRAIALATAGAQPEAIAELEAARGATDGAARRAITQVLLSQYQSSTATKKAKPLADELAPKPDEKGEAPKTAKTEEKKP